MLYSSNFTPSKFQKKPVIVEAIQFKSNNGPESVVMDVIVNWVNQGKSECHAWHNGTDIFIKLWSGWFRLTVGNWIIKKENGEFYTSSSNMFRDEYDPA